jgi:O-antigen/teichoic acid export membrane protein
VSLSPWLAGLLRSRVYSIIWMAALVTVTAMLVTFYGAIQGRNAYGLYSVAKVAEAAMVLVTGSTLVILGAGASGAVLGYVLGALSPLLFFLTRRQLYTLCQGTASVRAELRTFVSILLVYATALFVSDFSVVLARSRLSAYESGLYAALYSLRQLVLPFCSALAAPLYSRTVSEDQGHTAFVQVLAIVSGLGGAFLAIGVLAPRLPFLLIYGPAFAEASRYVVAYGFALLLLMLSIVTMFYQVARSKIVLVHLLVPVVVLVIASVLPSPSIPRLILSQAIAWGCYLVVTLVSIGVGGVSDRKEMALPGATAEIVGRRKAE